MNGTKRPLPEDEGEEEKKKKLTKEQVTRIRQRYHAGGISVNRLAEIYGISRAHCTNIVKYLTSE